VLLNPSVDLDVAGSNPVTRPSFFKMLVGRATGRAGCPEGPLAQRRAHPFQALEGAKDLWLIGGEMANDNVGVAKFRHGIELPRHLVDRPRDQRFGRDAAIAPAQRLLQHRLSVGR